jgi:hypothetical protein
LFLGSIWLLSQNKKNRDNKNKKKQDKKKTDKILFDSYDSYAKQILVNFKN